MTSQIPGTLTLQLPSGNIQLQGSLFGHIGKDVVVGEVVFQTGMVGYPESLTDPSYCNQILVLTYPLIGNYGVPDTKTVDEYGIPLNIESDRVHVKALIVGEYVDHPSHYQASQTLSQWLDDNGVPGLSGIDTRRITELTRKHGTVRGVVTKGWTEKFVLVPPPTQNDLYLAAQVCRDQLQIINDGQDTRVLVVDCGIKNNQLRFLLDGGKTTLCIVGVTSFPHREALIKMVDHLHITHIFISNGPGDPRDCSDFIAALTEFMSAKEHILPLFGICLGHQLLALAAGFGVKKMKYGNRGHNQPCRLVGSHRTYQTTQNHGYAVQYQPTGVPDPTRDWNDFFVNLNDGSNEGLYHKNNNWFSVQFHPEARGGPDDTSQLFDHFLWGTPLSLGDEPVLSEAKLPVRNKVLILGSGGLCIGQSGEFDYSGAQAIKAYREEGLTTVLVNPNVATVQTSPGFVDRVYFLPVTPEFVTKVIEIERPDCIALSFGGQTALNTGAELDRSGVLEQYNVHVLGTPVHSILMTEDRDIFKRHIQSIGEQIPNGVTASNIGDAVKAAESIGYPVLVRAAYALGGLGSGFANNRDGLEKLLDTSFANSDQVIIDKSLKGWKEVEYEIVRDRYGNCISVCNMENLDPLGVHTGESIVVAPSQTLSDEEYMMLRATGLKTVDSLGIVGECNIQYALDPTSKKYYIIEINARLSRSSALASKATGYPLAYVAAKLGLGYGLDELQNTITGCTTACFEPSLDYCVVKIPRWDLTKFGNRVNTHIGSAMKSVGEGMAISRSFEEALQSAIRMTGMCQYGLKPGVVACTDDELRNPTYRRILAVATGLSSEGEYDIDRIHDLSGIDRWFLYKIREIVQCDNNHSDLRYLKRLGYSDAAIANREGVTELVIRKRRLEQGIRPDVKKIDTVSAEFPCKTNYLYQTYATTPQQPLNHEVVDDCCYPNKVLVLGSGVYKIGSSVEFDWCAVSCIRQLRKMGKEVIMVNCNPETVSTDYDEADKLYFCELSLEAVLDIYERERPSGVVVSVGGQLPNNIAMGLHMQGVRVIGTSPENIDRAENRFKFSRMLGQLAIDQPEWCNLVSIDAAKDWCNQVGYPCLVRPSYVLSGAAMNVAYSDEDLERFLGAAVEVSPSHPVVISKFINDAKEIEVDAVACNGKVKLLAISEHVENAGVHSGDATLIFPPQDLTPVTRHKIKMTVHSIARELGIHGPVNIQFIAKDDNIKVIECNLRVSRSFPFVSKTMGTNMVAKATEMWMMKQDTKMMKWDSSWPKDRVGVKVPQFSFNRLTGADILLGVEMQSTGEVACYGKDHREAYIKGLIAAGFRMPSRGSKILLSIGGFGFKKEFQESVELLQEMGYKIYGTRNTAGYYSVHEMRLHSSTAKENVLDWIRTQEFSLVINVTERNKMRCVEDAMTDGYRMRRAAIEGNVPIVTDIKVAKLLVQALRNYPDTMSIPVRSETDCFANYNVVRIPGLIDVHVHVRDPGETHKEDWQTCTSAALAGGITMICAMPNTNPPLVNDVVYDHVNSRAHQLAVCDYALFAGASSSNYDDVHSLAPKCAGLKMYLNNTHGPLLLDNTSDWDLHVMNWDDSNHPICVHAEGQTLAALLHIAGMREKRVHVCHVARKEEIRLIRQAKVHGMKITCEVAPHHLFLIDQDMQQPLCKVKPCLQTDEDRQALWDNMDIIDCFATDHAPHTLEDKHTGPGCPGFPGLETALPLLLTAVHNGRLSLQDIIQRYHTNPKRIFNLPDQPDTYVEIDMDERYTLEVPQFSKAGWSPFVGRECVGAVKRVVLRGKTVFLSDRPGQGVVTTQPGQGQNVRLNGRQVNTVTTVDTGNTVNTVNTAIEISDDDEDVQSSPLNRRPSLIVRMPRNLTSTEQLTKPMLRMLFERTDEIRRRQAHPEQYLHNKKIGLFFYEPSSRTRLSFETATEMVGGITTHIGASQSSVKKGESLVDSIRTLEACGQVDAIVLRHPDALAAQKAVSVSSVPVINAGDGDNEHPTQALIDLYTIRNEIGTVGGLCVVLMGDLRYGRTVHSLAKALALRDDVRLHYVSPVGHSMPTEVVKYIEDRDVYQSEHNSLSAELLASADVLYMTRLQAERSPDSPDWKEYEKFGIGPGELAKAKDTMRVLHPLPRGAEISTDIDNDPRCAYFRQMQYAPYVRAALLSLMIE